jgi:hypothetical protein
MVALYQHSNVLAIMLRLPPNVGEGSVSTKISFLECGPKDDAMTTCQTSVSRMTVRQKVF